MAIKLSTALRNTRAAQILAQIGATPKLRFYTGSAPSAASDPATGTLLAELTLPSVWLGTPSGGQAAQSGAWSTPAALASGTAGYFRIYDSPGTTCHMQGTIPDDMAASPSAAFTIGASVNITGYIFQEANA